MKLAAAGLAARTITRHLRARRADREAAFGEDALGDDTIGVGPMDADAIGIQRFSLDPGDPVQLFNGISELELVDLDGDLLEDVHVAQDLAAVGAELDELDDDDMTEMVAVEILPSFRDGGDFYGGQTSIGADRDLLDDDRAFAEGQNWVEALETSAIENGDEPGRELGVDDEDLFAPPYPADRRDIPVSDFGSGGRRGL